MMGYRMKLPNGASLVGFADDLVLLVVTEKAWLEEIIANEALELIAEWLISRSLQLTVRKCEAILVTRQRKYEAPRFEINGEVIPLKQEIKYFQFKHQTRREASRKPYGAPTWTDCIPAYLVDKHMGAVQRKINLRIISGWRILSRDAANVLSGVPPIRLLALERKEILVEEEEYRLKQGQLPEEERNIIRAKARETLFKRWQEEWDSSKDGRWTHKLIPKIKEWVLREHGSMEYRLTQGLGDHGCFGGYLAKREHRTNNNCRLCGEE